ncbi:MAG TPA: hypothetical protein PKD61_35995, partial [Polyangiaceae bacterium]|nr:hypothetical protein [Polyangiaceae bacterium]
MRFLPVVFVMICACGAPQPKASGPAPASASTQPPVATDTRIAPEIAEGPATAAPTPSAPLVMVDEPLSATAENATTKLLARGAVGASIAADGKTLLVVPRGRGAEIRDLQGKLLHQLKTHHVERSAFSPDSKFVALDEENGSTSVFETDTGQFVQSNKGDHPAFLDNRRLGLRDGCHARVVDVTRAATAATLGKACGTVVHTSLDYGTWWVATPGRFRLGVLQTFATLDEVHLPSGRPKSLIHAGARS